MDEIDRALAELAAKGGGEQDGPQMTTGPPTKLEPKWQAVKEVFTFDPKFLDADAELRRMFGSKVVSLASSNFPCHSLVIYVLPNRSFLAYQFRSTPPLLLPDQDITLDSPTIPITSPPSAEPPLTSLLPNPAGYPQEEFSPSLDTRARNLD